MKHTIIISVLSLCTLAATAKTTIIKPAANADSIMPMHKPFSNVGMDVKDEVVSFSKLPHHAVAMYIMDEMGNVATSGSVSRKHNKVSVKQLQPGLYTIVLKQGDKVSMYGYHTEVTVKASRSNS